MKSTCIIQLNKNVSFRIKQLFYCLINICLVNILQSKLNSIMHYWIKSCNNTEFLILTNKTVNGNFKIENGKWNNVIKRS